MIFKTCADGRWSLNLLKIVFVGPYFYIRSTHDLSEKLNVVSPHVLFIVLNQLQVGNG